MTRSSLGKLFRKKPLLRSLLKPVIGPKPVLLPRRSPLWLASLALACSVASVQSCVAPEEDRITCDDILTPEDARFSQIETLVLSADKGCAAGDCHGNESASAGYRFDERSVIYDGFTAHIEAVYGQIASGEMPEDGTRWTEDDLRIVRSWYCNGSSPNE